MKLGCGHIFSKDKKSIFTHVASNLNSIFQTKKNEVAHPPTIIQSIHFFD